MRRKQVKSSYKTQCIKKLKFHATCNDRGPGVLVVVQRTRPPERPRVRTCTPTRPDSGRPGRTTQFAAEEPTAERAVRATSSINLNKIPLNIVREAGDAIFAAGQCMPAENRRRECAVAKLQIQNEIRFGAKKQIFQTICRQTQKQRSTKCSGYGDTKF
jgi:hypothetical protein